MPPGRSFKSAVAHDFCGNRKSAFRLAADRIDLDLAFLAACRDVLDLPVTIVVPFDFVKIGYVTLLLQGAKDLRQRLGVLWRRIRRGGLSESKYAK